MTRVDPPRKAGKPAGSLARKSSSEREFDPPEVEEEDDPDEPDFLADETGLDLTDASELDADNVPADEEFDRVMQAPD